MLSPEETVAIPLKTGEGKVIANMTIRGYPGKPVIRLTASEVWQYGEEPIQLLEGGAYEYEIRPMPSRLKLKTTDVVRSSLIQPENGIRGTIDTSSHLGRICLELVDDHEHVEASGAIEIRSCKMDYREDYRRMLDFIAEKCLELLFQLKAPSQLRLVHNNKKDLRSLQQRFFFISSIIGSGRFYDALNQVMHSPHNLLVRQQSIVNISRSARCGKRLQQQLRKSSPRSPLPAAHPAALRFKAMGIAEPTLPKRVELNTSCETVDTPENRFVKQVVKDFVDTLREIERNLCKCGAPGDAFASREVSPLRKRLDEHLERDFFRRISPCAYVTLGSPVLQQKSGYREILNTWIKYNLASQLAWAGGEDVFGGNKKDAAILYEYWVFFQLLDIITRKVRLDVSSLLQLFEKTNDGMGVRLKAGKPLPIKGILDTANGRPLNVLLCYNRSFSGKPANRETNYPFEGSWTRIMRPDCTLSFWPQEFTAEEAEYNELMVHLHFDAKYRIDRIREIFGDDDGDAAVCSSECKSDDLLKMHAYRDAIRRTEAAFVIYPGEQNQVWHSFQEILPGLGAFVLRPGRRERDGISKISDFLDKVIQHLSNRASSRERYGYHRHIIFRTPPNKYVPGIIPERENESNERQAPPEDHWMIVTSFQSESHREWVNKENLYAFAVSLKRPNSRLFQARHIICLDTQETKMPTVFRIGSRTPEFLLGHDLINRQYPPPVIENTIYVAFRIEKDAAFESLGEEIRNKRLIKDKRECDEDLVITLADVFE